MEDVLDVYKRPYDPKRPLICMDEITRQLLADVREVQPAELGKPERFDTEYKREGVADVFLFFEPLSGQRHLDVTEHRTRKDWAEAMRKLSDEWCADAERILLVCDNLNIHTPASFYEAFEPNEARRLFERFEFHFTPKHGSWLNMAEIEFSVLSRQCLNRRIPDITSMTEQVLAWADERNRRVVKVDWQFTTADARIKLRHLYPQIES
jgi:hypothetical protein